LHHAAKHYNPEIIGIILKSLPEQERLVFLKEQNQLGNTPLHLAVQNSYPQLWFTLIECLPEKDRLDAVTEMSSCGYTPLEKAAENTDPQILHGILKLYPKSKRIEAIERVEAWWRRHCLIGIHQDLLKEEKEKIKPSYSADISPKKITTELSKFGLFSKPEQSELKISPLTPLQASLLEHFVY
jgi:hypothetical protein